MQHHTKVLQSRDLFQEHKVVQQIRMTSQHMWNWWHRSLEMSAVKNVIKDNYNMVLLKDYLRSKIKMQDFLVEVSKHLPEQEWSYM